MWGRITNPPQLVKAVVKSTSLSGMEMINASKVERKAGMPATAGVPVTAGVPATPIRAERGQTVDVISHEIILKGSYPGFVKFLQSMAAWEMGAKIESMEIEPGAAEASPDEINVTLRLSVFSLAQ